MSITARSLKNYQVEINAGGHQIISDEPVGIGDGVGPGPFDLLLGALASCTIITLHMYANRKNWPLERVELSMNMQSAEAAASGDPDAKVRQSAIESSLTLHGPLTREQMLRLEQISNRCPVHRTLRGQIEIRMVVSNLPEA